MGRPRKCRRVCSMPKICEFSPVGAENGFVALTVDEYESVRLIDKEGLSQEECSEYMQVARTTAQQIYNSAKTKIATALVEGKSIRIEGGDYRLCEGGAAHRGCGGCHRQGAKCPTKK